MKSIWYFVGLILLIMGGIIFLSGIYSLVFPPEREVILGQLHTSLWWGIVMAITGVVFVWRNRDVSIR